MKLYPKKKKERTDQQKVRRGKFAIIFIVIAILVVIFIPTKKKGDAELDPMEKVRLEMDSVLDSLLDDITDSAYEVYYKGDIEEVPIIPEIPEEEELTTVNMQIKMLENKNIPAKNRTEELELAMGQKAYLEKRIQDFKESAASKIAYDSRRIRFRTADGCEYTCFQQRFMDRNRLKHLQEITKAGNAESEFEKMQERIAKDNN